MAGANGNRSIRSRPKISGTPEWISASGHLSDAFYLAARAHGSERRPSDGRLFLEHVSEVAGLLHRLEFDEELIAVGLLHDSVERGALREPELRDETGDSIAWLVMALSEDSTIESFEGRKGRPADTGRRRRGASRNRICRRQALRHRRASPRNRRIAGGGRSANGHQRREHGRTTTATRCR